MRKERFGWCRSGLAALTALAMIGCSGSAALAPDGSATLGLDGRPDGSFTTDSAVYTARHIQDLWPGVPIYGFTLVTRYTNPTQAPVFLWRCYPDSPSPMYSVVAPSGGSSTGIAYNAAWACVGHDRPIRVDPGATRTDTIHVRGPNGFDGITHRPIDPIVEGTFRLQFVLQSCRTEGDCPISNEALSRSNEFTVRLEK